jgi:hypothetical protein
MWLGDHLLRLRQVSKPISDVDMTRPPYPPAAAGDDMQTAGRQLLNLITTQLAAENQTRQSMEARALTVITTSGTFITLLLAFITWYAQLHRSSLPGITRLLLGLGLVFLLLATVASLAVNAPSLTGKIDAASLLGLVESPSWHAEPEVAQREIARAQARVLLSSELQNRKKSRLLTLSTWTQVGGLMFVASAAGTILVI